MSRPSEYEFPGHVKVKAMIRAEGKCEECGFDGTVQIHHLLPIYYATNYYPQIAPYLVASLDNAKVLCHDCHRIYDSKTAKEHSYWAAKLLGYLD